MDDFRNYQRELDSTINNIKSKLRALPTYGESRKDALLQAEDILDNAKELLNSLRALSRDKRGAYDAQIKNYEREIDQISSEISSHQSTAFIRTKASGLSYQEELDAKEYDQKTRLLAGHEKLQGTKDRLQQIRQIGSETEEIGIDTLDTMKKQREQLEGANRRLDEVDSSVKRARKILSAMSRRVVTNKLILIFIIVVLIGTIVIVVYFRWIKKDPPPVTHPPTLGPTHSPNDPVAFFG
eukprot:TRINITY_DN5645_c0_g1_i1.p1 TRINITY_DN5645_c0_g1~~TRINITY_DN5645_c0_g1_i1.p1  ORF type:complete len:240 (+),score=53.09 TRINITY_DN5645_c0_g1_i1:87-806(+)